jgi:hypothetical protein
MDALLMEIAKYIKPELSVLVIVAFCVGLWLKKNPKISDFLIPLILVVMCLILSTGYLLVATVIESWRDVLLVILSAITQAILIAFSAMGVYDVYKNTGKYIVYSKTMKLGNGVDAEKGIDDTEGGGTNG